jgi:hypothetical protein
MKFSELISKEHMNLAVEAGKRLAKMVQDMNLAPPKAPVKKPSFGAFFQTTIPQQLQEVQSSQELKEIEVGLRKVLGWEVHCSSHFVERVFGRERDIPVSVIIRVFQKMRDKYRIQLAKATQMGEVECVVKDYANNLNIVFVLRGKSMDLTTIMLKDCDHFTLKTGPMKQMSFRV